MKPDKYKKRYRVPKADDRLRNQIALEAARRMLALIGPDEDFGPLRDASEADYYAAKRRAAAVLGHHVRPGDLPSDSEVREHAVALVRQRETPSDSSMPEPESDEVVRMADHLDRFAIYKLRLEPLESVKQNPVYHPEGDALYHSLQVFALAQAARPYDEEFLLAALLHDVGKAIDPKEHVAAALVALQGTITERTAWLIEHHMDLLVRPGRPLKERVKRTLEASPYYDDLVLLRDVDEGGRVPGMPVGTIDDALTYMRGLEAEEYLD
jgi:predicted HD phosphohydrolase